MDFTFEYGLDGVKLSQQT